MVSISEDCTVKLWSLKGLDQQFEETEGNPEPYITLRGHTGPLFSVTGPNNSHERVIFTAGSEGIIRVFNVPHISEVNQFGDTYDGKNYCIGTWAEPAGEAFWDIRHHPYSVSLCIISNEPLEPTFISKLQQFSFSLEHIRHPLGLVRQPRENCQSNKLSQFIL